MDHTKVSKGLPKENLLLHDFTLKLVFLSLPTARDTVTLIIIIRIVFNAKHETINHMTNQTAQ